MFKIANKKFLNDTICEMDILAPLVAKKAEPGQFIILRVDENGERIPLTIAGYDKNSGTVKIIFQIVGATTEKLKNKNIGDYILDFVGPLGNETKTNSKNVCIIGGGLGNAIAFPIAEKFHNQNANVTVIEGFKNKEFVILEDELKEISDDYYICTDDGSYGEKGNVCIPLSRLLLSGKIFDEIIAIGPIIMMKYVSIEAKKYNIPCTVSMNPLMIDGTGMCGCCRLMINGQMKFACVDGPDFNSDGIDFDELMARNGMYREFESHAREKTCNLFKKEIK